MTSSPESLIGQLIVIGLHGLEVDTGFKDHYASCPSGGFILFERNVRDRAQVRKLTGELSALFSARGDGFGQPLIAIDQESGTLSPLKGIVRSLPGNMGLAATGDPGIAGRAGFLTGRELLSLGINTNLAPVLDLARDPLNPAIGPRSFGDAPHRVAAFGSAFAGGLLETGALFVAKHFPGHGSVTEDSHFSLPKCTLSKEDLLAGDIIPFVEVMKLPSAAVMISHVVFTELDPDYPASLSHALITDFLRGELGFDGVVCTDCLEMGGVRQTASVPEAAVRAIEAGCDLVLVSHSPDLQRAAFMALREAVFSGRIPMQRVEHSVERINRWKQGLARQASPAGADSCSSIEHLGERVVTLIEGEKESAWRFGPGAMVLVTPSMERLTPAEDGTDIAPLVEELERNGLRCAGVDCSFDPGGNEIKDVIVRIDASLRMETQPGCPDNLDVGQRLHERISAIVEKKPTCPNSTYSGMLEGDQEFGTLSAQETDDDDTAEDTADTVVHAVTKAGIPGPRVALVVRNAGDAAGQAALAAEIASRWPLLLIGIRDPLETRMVEEALTRRAPAVFTYSTEPIVLSALARVLAGKTEPKGVMPVRI